MKKRISENAAFYPCGLEIPESDIFKSKRNLGISLLGALTGTPSEDVEINRTAVSIGLGSFSLIAVGNSDYDDNDDFNLIDEDEDWGLNSSVRFSVTKGFHSDEVVAGPVYLFFNISPACLLEGDIQGIQLFGPWRYLKMLQGENDTLKKFSSLDAVELGNYLEFGCEPSDGMLCPDEEEFELFKAEKDPSRKFRILLNLITTFASEISVRMQVIGKVEMSMVYGSGADVDRILIRARNVKLPKLWRPTLKAVESYLKKTGMKEAEIDPDVRRILWPKKYGAEGDKS